ncbi:cupin domain-containing protein [Williamsia deligens]|uniref:Cupin domain-containing protein n=1 Tax=Williamsia deligens TaxID=321325 RepID=A0ABW3G543_9NOCA|nr:cupin domain-containing protein [Williamsia deligens]MCP2193472.1 Cupin domain protein [Williamsia deligens]
MQTSAARIRVLASRVLLVAACGAGIASTTLPAASATPSAGITAQTLAAADIPAGLLPFISGPGTATARRITIAPGGTTGWHFHDGRIVGIVESGTLTHPGADCKPVTYRAGQLIIEPEGKANTHRGQNLTDKPVVLDVVYLLPKGAPFFEDAAAPPCDR